MFGVGVAKGVLTDVGIAFSWEAREASEEESSVAAKVGIEVG